MCAAFPNSKQESIKVFPLFYLSVRESVNKVLFRRWSIFHKFIKVQYELPEL